MNEGAQYAVIFGLDRLATDADIEELGSNGRLGSAKRALTVQLNIGPNRDILAQSSNIIFEGKFKAAAQQEWARKGFNVSTSDMYLSKVNLSDGGLFVVAILTP